jgi:hypothetical protein
MNERFFAMCSVCVYNSDSNRTLARINMPQKVSEQQSKDNHKVNILILYNTIH